MAASSKIQFDRMQDGVWCVSIDWTTLLTVDKHEGEWRARTTTVGHDAMRLSGPLTRALRLLADSYDGAPWHEVRRTIRAELQDAIADSGETPQAMMDRVMAEHFDARIAIA